MQAASPQCRSMVWTKIVFRRKNGTTWSHDAVLDVEAKTMRERHVWTSHVKDEFELTDQDKGRLFTRS